MAKGIKGTVKWLKETTIASHIRSPTHRISLLTHSARVGLATARLKSRVNQLSRSVIMQYVTCNIAIMCCNSNIFFISCNESSSGLLPHVRVKNRRDFFLFFFNSITPGATNMWQRRNVLNAGRHKYVAGA